MRQSFTSFGRGGRLTCLWVMSWWHSPHWLCVYHQVHVCSRKRIAWTFLSQLSLACQPSLTKGGNVNFIPGKFRAVYLRGLSVLSWSITMCMFHAVMFKGFFWGGGSTALREFPDDCGKLPRQCLGHLF